MITRTRRLLHEKQKDSASLVPGRISRSTYKKRNARGNKFPRAVVTLLSRFLKKENVTTVTVYITTRTSSTSSSSFKSFAGGASYATTYSFSFSLSLSLQCRWYKNFYYTSSSFCLLKVHRKNGNAHPKRDATRDAHPVDKFRRRNVSDRVHFFRVDVFCVLVREKRRQHNIR